MAGKSRSRDRRPRNRSRERRPRSCSRQKHQRSRSRRSRRRSEIKGRRRSRSCRSRRRRSRDRRRQSPSRSPCRQQHKPLPGATAPHTKRSASSSAGSVDSDRPESPPRADPMAELEHAVVQQDPMAKLDEAASLSNATANQEKPAQQHDDIGQVDESSCMQSVASIASSSSPSRVVKVERICIPVLAARPPSSPSPSSNEEEAEARKVSLRSKASGRSSQHQADPLEREATRAAQSHMGPLERYLLRSGEILESYNVKSKVLRHRAGTS